MVFFLFILLNATVFIRPSEWYAPIYAWPIYQCIIVLCLVCALPAVLGQLSLQSIRANPITACVLGLYTIFTLSWAINPSWTDATVNPYTFAKTVAHYLLLVGIIDSRKKLNRFVACLALIIAAAALVTVLSYHEFMDIEVSDIANVGYVDSVGELKRVDRVSGPGSHYDSNDIAIFLVMGIIICAHMTLFTPRKVLRLCWLAPLGLVAYHFWLTQSRGGYLALTAAVIAWAYANWGFRKTLCLAVPLYVALSATMMSGRMTNIELEGGTGQARIQLWTSALVVLKQHPLFGVGPGNIDAYTGGSAVHNAFLTMYAELGFVGGTFFTGAFAIAVLALWQIRSSLKHGGDVGVQRIVTTILAATIAFAAGNLALSQQYLASTFLVLGLAEVCLRTYGQDIDRPIAYTQFDLALVTRLAVAGVAFVVVVQVFAQFLVRW